MGQQDPLSNRACGFPAHGLRVISRADALRGLLLPEGLLRIADGSAQAVKTDGDEVAATPAFGLSGAQMSALAIHAQGSESAPHVAVELVEPACGVSRAEVVAPP